MRTLYFIRHGETDWNAEGRLQGQRDIPLNEVGQRQAEKVGRRLRDLVPQAEALAYLASPLGRARDTMERLRWAIGLPSSDYTLDARLAEITFGAWEGLTWREVRARDPSGAAAREVDRWGFVPPGGESYALLTKRVAPLLDDIDQDAVLVSHGGVARAVLALIGAVTRAEAPRVDIWQGRVLVIEGSGYRWA